MNVGFNLRHLMYSLYWTWVGAFFGINGEKVPTAIDIWISRPGYLTSIYAHQQLKTTSAM